MSRALGLIWEGAMDEDGAGVLSLAESLGVGDRHLRRIFQEKLGASPLAVAQTRRVHLAKQLIQETHLPMADIAMMSGFGSIRRFNETFHTLYGRPPTALRRSVALSGGEPDARAAPVRVRIRYRPPFDWESMLAFLRARAIQGVECVTADTYYRSARHQGSAGLIEVRHEPARDNLVVTLSFASMRALPRALYGVRRVFDLDGEVELIGSHLSADPLLAALVAARPGLRCPGGWDGFELAVRAILGQQVSVRAALRLLGELVAICGEPLGARCSSRPEIAYVFPSPERVAEADLERLRMPRARQATLRRLAEAAAQDKHYFNASQDPSVLRERLQAIAGIGEWTIQYVLLRGLRDVDAFPATDAGLLRAFSRCTGAPISASALLRRSESWRPWRAYAAQHLWAADSAAPACPSQVSHG